MKEAYDIIVTIEDKEIREYLKIAIDKVITSATIDLDFGCGAVFGMAMIAEAKNVLSEMDMKMLNKIVAEYARERKRQDYQRKQHKK